MDNYKVYQWMLAGGLGLIHKGERHEGLLTVDYTADITTVARILSPPTCRDPDMLKAFKGSLSKKTLLGM